jgi:hypothetical protein
MVEGYLFLADRRRKRDVAQDIVTAAMGARSKPADVKKKLKELTKD